jgi:hypothetical protein
LSAVATESPAVVPGDSPPRSGPRAEFVLLALTGVSLALLPVHIKNAYSGLPAHPLLLHVPVILIPVATVWSLVLVFRPSWVTQQGVFVSTVAVAALAGTILAMGSGSALRAALHLGRGGEGDRGIGGRTNTRASLVAQHSHAANTLRLAMIAFTLVLVTTVLAHRVADGRPLGRAALDRLLARPATRGALRGLLAALAVGCAYCVFHTGDLGAKAVWNGRVRGGVGGPPGLNFPGPGDFGGAGRAPRGPGESQPAAPGG